MAVQTADPRSGPRLAAGTELIGEFEGSGFKEPPSLARRGDGQVIQLTPLLYSVAAKADGAHTLAEIATDVGHEIGRTVTADNVRTLVDAKLRPLGLVTAPDGSQPDVEKLDPLLALKFRYAVVPERVSRALGSTFIVSGFGAAFIGAIVLAIVNVLRAIAGGPARGDRR